MADLNVEIAASLGRFEREMAKVESRLTRLANNVEKKAGAQLSKVDASAARTSANLNKMVGEMGKAEAGARRYGSSLQQVGFQVGDFATQVGAGTSATQALGQQLPQLLGAFGTFGALAGAAAAIMIPLGSAIIKTAFDSETLEERMKALEKSTDAMKESAELAARPISELRAAHGDLADEIQRSSQMMAAFVAAQAGSQLRGAAGATAALFPDAAVQQRVYGMSDTEWAAVQEAQARKLMKATGATREQVDELAMALRRLESANGPEAVLRDSENLLRIMSNLPDAAGNLAPQIAAIQGLMKQAQTQVEAQRLEVTRLYEEYDKTTSAMKSLAEDLAKAEAERAKAVSANKTAEVEQWDRVIAKIREMVYETKAAAQETDTLFERMTKSAQGFIEKATSGAKGYMSTDGFAGRYIAERTRGSGSQNEELVRATAAAAEQLGIATKDLLSIIMLESGGRPDIRGGAGNRHIGLIQFGPAEQKKYGAAIGQTITQQMAAVVAYLKDRGVKPGMALPNVYAAVNAGQAHLTNRGDTRNGGIVDNIYNFTTGPKMQPYLNRAEGLLAAYPDIIHESNEAIKEQNRLETESAANLKREVKERERKAEAVQKAREAMAADLVSQQKAADLEAKRAAQVAAINTGPGSDAEKAAAIAAVNAAMEKQITIMALTEEAKRRQVDLDAQMVGSTMTYRQAIAALGEAKAQGVIFDQQVQASTERLAEAQQFAQSQMQSLQDGFIDAIIAGEDFADVLKNVAAQMAKAWAQSALFGTGPMGSQGGGGLFSGLFKGGGFLSSLFGGFRANGGDINPGKFYIAGERGPEIIVPKSPGKVIPNHKLGGGGGSVSMVIDVRGATGNEEVQRMVARGVEQGMQQVRREVPSIMSNHQTRRG